jgi:ATP-binding protein involved in chromosome partitioning
MMMGIEAAEHRWQEHGADENYGVQVMSIGFLVARDEAMIWRDGRRR